MAWKIDPSHTALGFAVRHMMITTVRGKFEKVDADIDVDAANLSQAKVSARIDAASVNTAEEKRDGHLRSPDFFDVEKYPTIEFKSTKVSQSGQDLTVEGLLKIKEAEHPITLKGEVIGPGKDPWG